MRTYFAYMASVSPSMIEDYFLEELRQSVRISAVTAHKVGEADRHSSAITALKRDSIVTPTMLARKLGIGRDSTMIATTKLVCRSKSGLLKFKLSSWAITTLKRDSIVTPTMLARKLGIGLDATMTTTTKLVCRSKSGLLKFSNLSPSAITTLKRDSLLARKLGIGLDATMTTTTKLVCRSKSGLLKFNKLSKKCMNTMFAKTKMVHGKRVGTYSCPSLTSCSLFL
jgi:ribosomal protein S25